MQHTGPDSSAEAKALARVRGYASAGRIEVSPHARRRMRERGVYFEDLRVVLAAAASCRAEAGDRWRVEGRDTAGDDLEVIVVLADGVVMVTLF